MRPVPHPLGRFAGALLLVSGLFGGLGTGPARAGDRPPDPAAVPGSPDGICALLPGEAVPSGLRALDGDGRPFDLDAALRDKPTLLIFYRGGW